MYSARNPDDIDRFFRGLTEHAFHARLGIVDPPLVDYVSLLLVRFIRNDQLRGGPGPGQAGIDDVATMLSAVREAPAGAAAEEYRHIGDYTLFWSGLYPEALQRSLHASRLDPVLDYRAAGKRAYWIASTLEPDDAADERMLLERLSHEYDLCVEGLSEVRRSWKD